MKWITKKPRKQDVPLSHSQQLQKLIEDKRFCGVQVHRSSCKAGAKCAGIIFSFKDVPKLPLDSCDAPNCYCEYMGVPDRRRNHDRRSGTDRRFSIRQTPDRRIGNDRRSEANTWKGYDF